MLWVDLCVPPESYIDTLTPALVNVNLFRNSVFSDYLDLITPAETLFPNEGTFAGPGGHDDNIPFLGRCNSTTQVKVRSLGSTLTSMTGVLTSISQRHTQGGGGRGRDWTAMAASHGMPRIDSRHPKLEEVSKDSTRSLRGDTAPLTPSFWTSDLQKL